MQLCTMFSKPTFDVHSCDNQQGRLKSINEQQGEKHNCLDVKPIRLQISIARNQILRGKFREKQIRSTTGSSLSINSK